MKILLVASEANPFIKTGGLGDVIGALSKSLANFGHDVRVIIPKYKNIKNEYIEKMEYKKYYFVDVGWRHQYCGLLEIEDKGVKYYFLDNEYYFKRDGLYGYYDDGERFAFFDRAVLETLREIDWYPDILHCNDWQCGMIPVLYKLEYQKKESYKNMKMVYTIHNLLFQGNYAKEVLKDLFGYDYRPYDDGSLEAYGAMSFMKGGINYSDLVTTVSKTYAKEVQTPWYGERLDGVLRYRGENFKGIVNGIDYEEFNPETDKFISTKYNIDTIKLKGKNKLNLQKELGLEVNEDIPMVSMVSRLTDQKGVKLIMDTIDRVLLEEKIQLVILGTGDRYYEEFFEELSKRHREKVSVHIYFDNELAHKIYASSDIFLMPSLFEPCGLGQLIALKYGTIPIVRETGGLKDTVTPYNKYEGVGNGFSFANFYSEEFYNKVKEAIGFYYDKNVWEKIKKEAMLSDNSWEKSSLEYINSYQNLINNK